MLCYYNFSHSIDIFNGHVLRIELNTSRSNCVILLGEFEWLVIKFSFMCFIGLLPLQSSSFYGSRAGSKDYASGGTNLDRYELVVEL